MSKILVGILYLIIIFWSIPQANKVFAVDNCSSLAQVSFGYVKNDIYYDALANQLPRDIQKLFIYLEKGPFIESLTYRLNTAAGQTGQERIEAIAQGGQLKFEPTNILTRNNGRHSASLEVKIDEDKWQSYCQAITYNIGNTYSRGDCQITLNPDPVTMNTSITAMISQAPQPLRGEEYYVRYSTEDFLDKSTGNYNAGTLLPISIDADGNGQFNFNTNAIPKENVYVELSIGKIAWAPRFCKRTFSIIGRVNNKPNCAISPTNPTIYSDVKIIANNVENSKNYWASLTNKDTDAKTELPDKNVGIEAKNRTVTIQLNEPPQGLSEGNYVAELYGTDNSFQCITQDFTVGGLTVSPPKIKACDPRKDKNCSTAGGDPCTNDTDPRGPGFKTAIGCIRTNPTELAKDLLKFGVGIGGGLAFLMMLLGAFQMLTSAGNPETLNAGKERLTSAIIGLLIVIFAVLLLQIIGFDILKIPGFDR